MKLHKDRLNKTVSATQTKYEYRCDDEGLKKVVLQAITARNEDVQYKVYAEDNKEDEFATRDPLEAWRKFEELIEQNTKKDEQDEQDNNPQQQTRALPLLAFEQDSAGTKLTLFLLMEDSGEQVVKGSFIAKGLDYSNLRKEVLANNVFATDWSALDVPDLFKCKISLSKYETVVFEGNKNALVTLFIPESIFEQGGDPGGQDDENKKQEKDPTKRKNQDKAKKQAKERKPEPGEQPQEPKPEGGDDGPDDDEGGDDKGDEKGQKTGDKEGPQSDEQTDEPPEGTGGKPGDDEQLDDEGEDEQPDDEGDDKNEGDKGGGSGQGSRQINVPEAVIKIADMLGVRPDFVTQDFYSVSKGELFLYENDFTAIKTVLNLPSNMTARELAEQINKSL